MPLWDLLQFLAWSPPGSVLLGGLTAAIARDIAYRCGPPRL